MGELVLAQLVQVVEVEVTTTAINRLAIIRR